MNNQTGCFEALWMFIWGIIKHSAVYKFLIKIYSQISDGWKNSRIAGWFRVLHVKNAAENSVAGKVARCPFTAIEKLQKKFGERLKDAVDNSLIFNMVKTYLESILALNLKFIGLIALSSAVGMSVVKMILGYGLGTAEITAAVIGFVLSFVNVNFTDYLKHSAITRAVCAMLDISPSFDWYDKEKVNVRLGYGTAVIAGLVFGALGGALKGILGDTLALIAVPALTIGVFAVMLIFKKPVAGVFCLIFAAPILPTMADVGLALLCILSLVVYAVSNKGFKFKFDGIGFFIIVFLCIYAVSAIASFTPKKSISICAIYFVFIAMYFVIINTVKTKDHLLGILKIFVISGTLVCLYGIAQYVFGWDTAQAWMDEGMFDDIKMRIYSTLGNPNVLGEYILLVLPGAISLAWISKKPVAKVVYALISGIMFGALILTFSRGCWIGILVAAAIFITFVAGKLWGLALAALPFLPLVVPESIINRFSSIGNMGDSSTSYRVYIWMGTLAMMKDFWLSGIGMGQPAFTAVYPFYSYSAIIAPHSHNLFLQILVECGITGIAVFLITVFLLLRRVNTGYQIGGKGHPISVIMTGLTAGLCGFLVQGMFDNCFYNYRVMLVFWCVVAVIRASVYIAEETEVKTSDADAKTQIQDN